MLIGLEYLHLNGILHRDIKPENLVLDNRGYVRITDLGIARQWRPENAEDTSGTPGYMGKVYLVLLKLNFFSLKNKLRKSCADRITEWPWITLLLE